MIHVATSAPQIDDGDNIQLVSPVRPDETSTIRHRSSCRRARGHTCPRRPRLSQAFTDVNVGYLFKDYILYGQIIYIYIHFFIFISPFKNR